MLSMTTGMAMMTAAELLIPTKMSIQFAEDVDRRDIYSGSNSVRVAIIPNRFLQTIIGGPETGLSDLGVAMFVFLV